MLRWFWAGLIVLCMHAGAQPSATPSDWGSADSASAEKASAIRSDSLDAAFKMQALNKILSESGSSTTADSVRYTPPSLGKLAIRMTLGLGVVLILIYVLFRMARKARGMEVRPGDAPLRSIQILETAFIGPNQKVVMLRIGNGRVLVAGATQERISTLCEITGEEANGLLEQHRASPVTPAQFSETVNHLLRRFRKDGVS